MRTDEIEHKRFLAGICHIFWSLWAMDRLLPALRDWCFDPIS